MGIEAEKVVATGQRWERIKVREADALSALCQEVYAQYYLHLWHDNGAWYQQMRYAAPVLAEELADSKTEFYWIRQEGYPVGYLKINRDARPDPSHFTTSGLEIERLYLLKACAGKGLGRKAVAWAEARAQQLGCDCVFLYTMDSSEAHIFYEKAGYLHRGEKRLDFERMKPEYRGMYLMIKELR